MEASGTDRSAKGKDSRAKLRDYFFGGCGGRSKVCMPRDRIPAGLLIRRFFILSPILLGFQTKSKQSKAELFQRPAASRHLRMSYLFSAWLDPRRQVFWKKRREIQGGGVGRMPKCRRLERNECAFGALVIACGWSSGRSIGWCPSPRNARTHSDAQVAEIAGSIRAFGFTNPILVGEEGDVIAGHGRLAAARKLGLAEVPVIALHGLSEMQRRQLVLADNRIALNAGWDLEMLQSRAARIFRRSAPTCRCWALPTKELAEALHAGVVGPDR